MKRFIHLYLLCSVVWISSCRSFKNITSNDVPRSQQSKKNNPNNSIFLDDVSVTPGSKQIISTDVSRRKKVNGSYSNSNNKNVETANASSVQLKYAAILDVPAEQLSNTLLLQAIDYWWGTKYCLGGSTENCIDCSGFTQNLMRDVYAINIPRTAQEQYNSSTHIKTKELQQGDLVFFQNSKRNISHVGVYIANNKFVHASVSNGVMISDLNENYWRQRYKGAGTMF